MLQRADFQLAAGRLADAESDLETAARYLREGPEPQLFAASLLRLAGARLRRVDDEGVGELLDEAEERVSSIARPSGQLAVLLEVCRLAKEMRFPDRPRIRRASERAIGIAAAARDAGAEQAARSFASFAG
jgi:hypothetical protein